MQLDEALSYLVIDAGQMVAVEDLLREAEEQGGDEELDPPDWQKDECEFSTTLQTPSDGV